MKYNAELKKPKIRLANHAKISNAVNSDFDTNLQKNRVTLERCQADYHALSDLRIRYRKNRDYLFGRQWSEKIYDPESKKWMTEETYIKNQGRVPLKNNMIASMVKNLVGQYRRNPVRSVVNSRSPEGELESEMMSNALQANLDANRAIELDVQAFKVFASSGAPIQKVRFAYIPEQNRSNILIENCNINRMFWNTDIQDIRLNDLRRIGQIHDVYINDVVRFFAKTKQDEQKIREIYSYAANLQDYWDSTNYMSQTAYDNISFYIPEQINKCRFYEVWEIRSEWRLREVHDPLDPESFGTYPMHFKKSILSENNRRIDKGKQLGLSDEEIDMNLITFEERMESFWYYQFLSPTGHCMAEGETPYEHESHPYAIILHPLIDGEVRGWIEDIIDQQRQINRMLTLMDFIVSTSSKNTLLCPEDAKPDHMSWDDFANQYTKAGGVVIYKPKPGVPIPQVVQNNSIPAGISEMFQIQMSMIEQISGIHGPIQGKQAPSGTPASLYEQEAANASLNTVDTMQVFADFKRSRDLKIIKLIKQYYKEDRFIRNAGKEYSKEARIYKAKQVADLDYDITISHSFDTPTYKQAMEVQLQQLVMNGLIPIETYLDVSSMPYAETILKGINKMKEQAQQGQMPQVPPEIQQAAQSGDPKAQAMMQQVLNGIKAE